MRRLCVRLTGLAALLVAVAVGLVALRTDVHRAGYRLHTLFREQRRLQRECCRLQIRVARLRSQPRLRLEAARLRLDTDETTSKPLGDARIVIDRASPAPP